MNKFTSTQLCNLPFSFPCLILLLALQTPTLFFVFIVHPPIIRASIENTIFPWFSLLHHVSDLRLLTVVIDSPLFCLRNTIET